MKCNINPFLMLSENQQNNDEKTLQRKTKNGGNCFSSHMPTHSSKLRDTAMFCHVMIVIAMIECHVWGHSHCQKIAPEPRAPPSKEDLPNILCCCHQVAKQWQNVCTGGMEIALFKDSNFLWPQAGTEHFTRTVCQWHMALSIITWHPKVDGWVGQGSHF